MPGAAGKGRGVNANGDSTAGTNGSISSRHHKRRPHTKSRNGCTTCKRRRVKCDETRPICKNCQHLRLECRFVSPASLTCADLQIMNLKLLHHYITVVAQTIADSGISTLKIWVEDVVEMGFRYPFLMHAVLMFSATHLSQRQPKEYCNAVVQHRAEALTLLRSEVQRINAHNLDPLVATSVLLILDAMANAALPSRMTPSSLPASTWLHHVRGAATILLAVGVLPPTSKFYSFMGVDLIDLASCNTRVDMQDPNGNKLSTLQCFMPELEELYPVAIDSPYFASLAFLDKLQSQRNCADFILRVFSFPALMDPNFIKLLSDGDNYAKSIVSAYYRLVRSYVKEMHDHIWFLNGVSTVLPIDMDNELGGLGFVTDALPISQNVESILARFDASFSAATASGSAGRTTLGALDFFEDFPIDNQRGGGNNDTANSSAFDSSHTSPTTAPGSIATSPNDTPDSHNSQQQHQPVLHQQQHQSQAQQPQQQQGQPMRQMQYPHQQYNQKFGGSPGSQSNYHGDLSPSMVSGHPNEYNSGRIHKQMNAPSAIMPGSGNRLRNKFGNRSAYKSAGTRGIIRPGMMGLPVDPSIPDQLLGNFDLTNSTNGSSASTPNASGTPGPFPPSSLNNSMSTLDFQQMMHSNNNSAAISPAANSMSSGSNASPWPVSGGDFNDFFFDTEALEWKDHPPPSPSQVPRSRVNSTASSMMSSNISDMESLMTVQPSGMSSMRNNSINPGLSGMNQNIQNMQNPHMQNPGMQNSAMQNSGMQNSGMQNNMSQMSYNSGQRDMMSGVHPGMNSGMSGMSDIDFMNSGLSSGGMNLQNQSPRQNGMMGSSFQGDSIGQRSDFNPIKSEISDNDFDRYIGLDGDEIINDGFD